MPLLEITLIFTWQIIDILLLKGNSQLSIPLLLSRFDTWVSGAERFCQLSWSWKSSYSHIDQVCLLIFFLYCKDSPVDLLVLTSNPDFFWFKHKCYFFAYYPSLRISRTLWPWFYCSCSHMLLQGVQGMRKTKYIYIYIYSAFAENLGPVVSILCSWEDEWDAVESYYYNKKMGNMCARQLFQKWYSSCFCFFKVKMDI